MNIITLKDFNLGGIADSALQGGANSMAEMVGCDIHSEPGFLKVNQALTKESASIVDDLVKAMVVCSDGNTYGFGSTNGKIFKRDSGGTWSLLYTASPAAGEVGILEAKEYQGYIYYAMESRLGRVAVGSPTDWNTRDDSWATFTNTDEDFHPMREVSQILYIGDAEFVAQVESGVFSAEALDIKTPLRVKALGTILTDLVLGTFVATIRVATEILRWNTWSGSYSVADTIPEVGINSFLDTDNYILVNAGRKGNIYSYDGQNLNTFKRIPGDWLGANEALVHLNATVNQFGLPLFGLSNISGNPAKQGIYSLGRYDRNYPEVLNLEWLISTGNTEGIDIGAIEIAGTNLLVAWKDTTGGTTYGVDVLDTGAKVATAYVVTKAINVVRNEGKALTCYAGYRLLPSGTTIKFYQKANWASSWTEISTRVDSDKKIVTTDEFTPVANVIQIKCELNSSSNNAPEVDVIELAFD